MAYLDFKVRGVDEGALTLTAAQINVGIHCLFHRAFPVANIVNVPRRTPADRHLTLDRSRFHCVGNLIVKIKFPTNAVNICGKVNSKTVNVL
jgi:hypothetical protein